MLLREYEKKNQKQEKFKFYQNEKLFESIILV